MGIANGDNILCAIWAIDYIPDTCSVASLRSVNLTSTTSVQVFLEVNFLDYGMHNVF